MLKRIQHYLLPVFVAAFFLSLPLIYPVNVFADSLEVDDLSFIYIEKDHVDLGDTQRVALGFDGTVLDEPVALYCANAETEGLVRLSVTSRVDGTYLFSSSFSSAGAFSLFKVEYASGATRYFSDDISNQMFSVGDMPAPYRLLSDDSSDDQLDSVFTNGMGSSYDSLESAVGAVSESSARVRNWVFVLDAGHGGWDSGAVGNGLREKDLTLQIARYCRDELQKYAGVRVIMTRDFDTSVTGVANTTNELIARAQIARDNNASLFMSFHINSGGGTGAEIWIPRQASWYSSFNELGESLGQDVLSRLASVGLVNRGTKNDYYDLNGTQLYYPDGSNADSLSVIRNCRQYGIPAVLVEHGFIDNGYDAGLLANSLYLQKMGQADALAIANQFGLSKEVKPDPVVSEMRDGKIKLSWSPVPNATKYAIALCNNDGTFNTYTLDCTDTAFGIDNLVNGSTYSFLVQAYVNGHWSTFTSDDFLTCKLVPAPEATAEATGDGEVTVSWKAVAGAERYAVAERLPGGSYRTYTLDEKGTSYKVADLANGVAHRFLVQARVNGSWSSTADGYLCSAAPSGTVRPKVSAKAGDRSVELSWGHVPGATRYAVAVRQGSGYKTYTLDCGKESYTVTGLSNGRSYSFLVQAWNGSSWSSFSESDLVACTTLGTPIMGKSSATVTNMVSLYNSTGYSYPSIYASKGASSIEDYCQLVLEEANAEGVKAEILFAQAMLETGWLQFGGSVKASRCNFGGIGAVNATAGGASFDDVRTGLRAQVQHLKAYASTEPLKNACVDPRFEKVERGVAPCVEDLNGRWAVPGDGYGQRVSSLAARVCL